ncbi:DUF2939 domain-containing protein [Ramlibacter sp. AN1015]|uniref:DUF2939 domain-containing protein n=1 Tax=Ramlibacter sp. AN1015 TaxID=3133428 RepID=UPI0030BDC380
MAPTPQPPHRRRRAPAVAALLAIAALLLLAAVWWWSPLWTLRQMAQAAQQQDDAGFNARVDYPRLRESLKAQLAARVAASMSHTPGSNPFAGLGQSLGLAMVNPVVDAMVRPEFVMLALRTGVVVTPGQEARGGRGAPAQAQPQQQPPSAQPSEPDAIPRWRIERHGTDRVLVRPRPPPPAEPKTAEERPGPRHPDEEVAFVFERSGFATWRLVALELPAAR